MSVVFDRKIFYDAVRPMFGGSFDQEQVDGLDLILSFWEQGEAPSGNDDIRFLAYEFATVFHETGTLMQPIEEWGRGEGHDYGETDPETGQAYYGRGYVQLTWRDNYAKATAELGLAGENDLEWHAEKALEPEIAVVILFEGMSEGWFTGVGLPDYFNDTEDDPYNARRVINGTDKAEMIAGYHESFLTALKSAMVVYDEPLIPELPRPMVTMTLSSDLPVDLVLNIGRNIRFAGITPAPE